MVVAGGIMRGGDYFNSEIDLENSAMTDALLEVNGVKLQISVKVKWEPSRNRDIVNVFTDRDKRSNPVRYFAGLAFDDA